MKIKFLLPFICISFLANSLFSQEPVDQTMIAKIKIEAFQNSKVMETTSYICDVYGPRLTGSSEYNEAANWCIKQLNEWGIEKAELESWEGSKNNWSVKKYDIAMISPRYDRIIGYPKAWSPATDGVISGTPVMVKIKSKDDFEKYRGTLKGKIVMNGYAKGENPNFEAVAERIDKDELLEMEGMTNAPPISWSKGGRDYNRKTKEKNRFYLKEGVAALIEPSWHSHHAIVVMGGNPAFVPDSTIPSFVISKEQYGRIQRIIDKEIPVKLELNLVTEFSFDSTGYNVIAEIPGTDKEVKDEVVMIGAHLDSWHAGTGATDNGANCAIMMEVMRILKVLQISPRRTIRMALWGGEEQGYFGSSGYVKKHFGNYETMDLLPEHEKLSAYFNLDNGSGKIRGIHLQGNEYVRPIFKDYLEPFDYLDANTISSKNTWGTDHIPFNWIGLPAFQFIQDPIEYSQTWHTNLDVYEALLQDDMKQAVTIIASMVYHVAMRDELIPREALPKPIEKME